MSFINLFFNVTFNHEQKIENKALPPPIETFRTEYAILLTQLDAKLLVSILSTKLVPKHCVVYNNYVFPELDEADPDGGQGGDGEEDEEEDCNLHVHPPPSVTSTSQGKRESSLSQSHTCLCFTRIHK